MTADSRYVSRGITLLIVDASCTVTKITRSIYFQIKNNIDFGE